MKWVIKGVVLLGVSLALLVGAAKFGLFPSGTVLDFLTAEVDFVRGWKKTLEDAPSAEVAAAALKSNKEGGDVVLLDDGEWVAVVMEHECCTGAGFNATLYVTSRGDSYLDDDTCYCGFFTLAEELFAHDKADIESFLDSVRARGLKLKEL